MYDELVKRLRELHPEEFGDAWDFAFACQQAMREAADAIEELSRENESLANSVNEASDILRRRWISVEEPPKDDRNIFICHGRPDFKAACVGHYDPESKLFYEDRNWFASILYDAMFLCEMPRLPLPEPPKEET